MSVDVLRGCADVVLLIPGGKGSGRLQNPFRSNATARHRQHLAVEDPSLTLAVAKAIVAGKLSNLRTGLLQAGSRRTYPERSNLLEAITRRRAAIPDTPPIQALMGLEGRRLRTPTSLPSATGGYVNLNEDQGDGLIQDQSGASR